MKTAQRADGASTVNSSTGSDWKASALRVVGELSLVVLVLGLLAAILTTLVIGIWLLSSSSGAESSEVGIHLIGGFNE